MDLVKKPLGSEGEVKVEVKKGKFIISLVHDHGSGKASLLVEEDLAYFLDKLAAQIPGVLDDAILALVKDAVLKLD